MGMRPASGFQAVIQPLRSRLHARLLPIAQAAPPRHPRPVPEFLPPWDGHPREAGLLWELRKGTRVAVCQLWTHPNGGEARVTVEGEWQRGEAGRDGLALVELALEWKQQFIEKGWTA